MDLREAYIVAAARTAVGKAPRGALRNTRPDDLAAAVFRNLLRRMPDLKPQEIEDVILGCAMPEAEQGLNVARISSLRAGLPVEISAVTVNRFCASGLQSIAYAAERIRSGAADCVLAGGAETMSLIPMGGHRVMPNPTVVQENPNAYISMGLGAELLADQFKISREEQDTFSLRSHQKALAAIEAGKFTEEIVPFQVEEVTVENGKRKRNSLLFQQDEGPRKDTSVEALAGLKPAFKLNGTVTAGNSSQTSDGAAAVVLMSEEKMKACALKPLARLISYATAGVAPELFGIGPVYAIPKALKHAKMSLDTIDIIELNEAFAAQALAVMQDLSIDSQKTNVNGGAIALGHPLGCTGARLTVSLIHELKRRGGGVGLVTMCVGGGMGAAGIFEVMG